MTKQEILKAIENGKSVWYSSSDKVVKIDFSKKNKYDLEEFSIFNDNYKITALVINYTLHYLLKYLFKTKAEAEHYLHHANITRTETLLFLTWEEFKEKKCFYFTNYSDYYGMDTVNKEFSLKLNVSRDKILLFSYEAIPLEEWEATEANFYKAYDECVRLFKEQ